jgi:hypothetical protein
VDACQKRRARRDDQAPKRRAFPKHWKLDLQARPKGTIVHLCRTDDQGAIKLLGRRWVADPLWVHRLIRAEVDLQTNQIRCYRLRRRAPKDQPLVQTFEYVFPKKHFHPT